VPGPATLRFGVLGFMAGAQQLPYSWCFDQSGGLYFNAQRPSGLEIYLQETNPIPADILQEGEEVRQALITHNLTKYNHGDSVDLETIYGPKTQPRVLVLGQVPDDQSIKLGCANPLSNNDLVRLAYEEKGRDCQIIYRPHPYVLSGLKAAGQDPEEVASIALVVTQTMDLPTALRTIDHVYVQSSLAGFEARFRGIPVTTTGCPFYSGWNTPGIESRQPNSRRTMARSVDEIFAAAYVQYPRYFNPQSGMPMRPMEVLRQLMAQREMVAVK
jgi:capsular polysaccharide export protein